MRSWNKRIVPFAKVDCSGSERQYLSEVLDSGWLTTASKAKRLETEFAKLIGCKYAFAVNSCTSALHLALDACGIEEGEKVLVPSLTFTATAEVVRYVGAHPAVVDVDRERGVLTPDIVKKALDKDSNIKAVMAVHYGGYPLLIDGADGISRICKDRGVRLISDAAHALPASRDALYVGNTGDITCFSFYANKTMTSGEGGMITTNNDQYAERIKLMRLHGIDRDVWDRFTDKSSSWEYDVVAPGYKYNMPDINAAIGLAQLERLEEMRSKRQKVAETYIEYISKLECVDTFIPDIPFKDHAWHLFPIILNNKSPISRDELINGLAECGISTSVHYKPIHRLKYYRENYNLDAAEFPNTESIWQNCVSLPIYNLMEAEDVEYVCEMLGKSLHTSISADMQKDNPMLNESFPPWPSFTQEEANAVSDTLLSNKVNYWTGDVCRQFEAEYADYFGLRYAISMSNGTVVLDAALHAIGIQKGDEVIVPPRTYMASVSAIVNCGGVPIFADVDLDSQNISVESIERCITAKTKAIMCVHLAGWPCDMPKIMDLANSKGIQVIEDCAQSHGAKINGQYVGSFGAISGWSFCQDKIMSTGGEGGMATTDDEQLWRAMWSYKDHGKSWSAVYEKEHPPGFRWLHESFGTNFRMTEMQGAIGRIQLGRLDDWLVRRKRNASLLWNGLADLSSLRVPVIPDHIEHSCYKCYVFVRPEALKASWSRDRLLAELMRRGVPVYSGSCSEVYLEKAFQHSGLQPKSRLPNAKELGETSLMFLVHPTIEDRHQLQILSIVKSVLEEATA